MQEKDGNPPAAGQPGNKENSYRNILKGTSVFGGVQVLQILMNLVRGKFAALFLGPEGVGIFSLFASSTNTLIQFSSLGLNLSIVKEVSGSKANPRRLGRALGVAGALTRLSALLGVVVCFLCAPWLSQLSFGSHEYALEFRILSVFVFLMLLAGGRLSMLQGLHSVKRVAYSSLAGGVAGVVGGIPLYWALGDRGIVPAMLVTALTAFCFYSFSLTRETKSVQREKFQWSRHGAMARRVLGTGLVLLVSSLINTCCTYGINIFVRAFGNLDDVGLFSAANSITMQYVGMVFSAIMIDYYPRLSACASDKGERDLVVDREMEMVSLLATPLCLLLIVTAPIVIRVLLTSEFAGAMELMRWLGTAMLLKALAYPLGCLPLVAGSKRLYFWVEAVGCNVFYIGASLLGYRWFGLLGLGYGAVAEQALALILYLAVNRWKFGYAPSADAWRETLYALMMGALGFGCTFIPNPWVMWPVLAVVVGVSGLRGFTVVRNKVKQGG